jgi:hypothetical protein
VFPVPYLCPLSLVCVPQISMLEVYMERVRDLLDAVSPTLDLGDSLVARLSQRRGSSGGSTSANIAAEDYSSDLQIREVRRWGGGGRRA